MILEGHFTANLKGRAYTGKPLFPKSKVIAFDVCDTLLLRKRNYENGQDCNTIRYQFHHQAEDVVGSAVRDFDKVVFWSTCEEALIFMSSGKAPFCNAHQRIFGGITINGDYVKDLKILNDDLSMVVAMEDEETFFDPLNRVIQVKPKDDLLKRYYQARALVNGNGKH